jgi:predicted acyltransferase
LKSVLEDFRTQSLLFRLGEPTLVLFSHQAIEVNSIQSQQIPKGRLLSLDFFRGLTMFLLIAEFTTLFNQMTDPSLEGTWLYAVGTQFHHHPWNGLRFWDLIQPFFMFIVGVAIPFSVANRAKKGQSRIEISAHVLQRSFLLLLLGWGLYCISAGQIVFRFQNVLAQLAVTYLIAYLIMRKAAGVQLLISFLLIIATEAIYRSFNVTGFEQPFVANQNFGTWFDLQYGGEDLNGSWVSFNAIPTTAHTIWGVLAGQLLRSERSNDQKLKILLIAGIIGVIIGYALDPVTPIIKRICTSSFILVSGGWTILALALCYWLIDIKGKRRAVLFFAIVGMNPLFIYLFAHVGGADFLRTIVWPFGASLMTWSTQLVMESMVSLIVLFLLWYICYWLYRKRIFIKI